MIGLFKKYRTIELRGCSIEAARWIESLHDLDGNSSIVLPWQTPRRKPPHEHPLGLSIGRALETRVKQCMTIAALRESPVEGLCLSLSGIEYQSAQLLYSAIHALAYATTNHGPDGRDLANEAGDFVSGKTPFNDVPRALAEAGVYSCLGKNEAVQIGQWMHNINPQQFVAEVLDMHGADAVPVYQAIIRDFAGCLYESVSIHGWDVCCFQSPETRDDTTHHRSK